MPESIIVFDVNETLLDLAVLDQPFIDVFGSAQARTEWFEQLLKLAMTAALVGNHVDFTRLGRAALAMVAAKRSVPLALQILKRAGFRLAALTNSTAAVVEKQLERAGLAPFFEVILSVDAVGRFKPAPEAYRMAASRLGVPTSGLRMVAAHNWDITGAMAAGCKGAFVARDGALFNPLAPQPDVIEPTLKAVAEAIVRTDGQTYP
jgi:2-haloacid dehalogenase